MKLIYKYYVGDLNNLESCWGWELGWREVLEPISSKYQQVTIVPNPLHLFRPTSLGLDLYPWTFSVLEPSSLDKCGQHPSSKKQVFIAKGDHYKKPQLDTMLRSLNCGEPSLQIHQSPLLWLREHGGGGRRWKDCKSQNTSKSPMEQSCPEMAA